MFSIFRLERWAWTILVCGRKLARMVSKRPLVHVFFCYVYCWIDKWCEGTVKARDNGLYFLLLIQRWSVRKLSFEIKIKINRGGREKGGMFLCLGFVTSIRASDERERMMNNWTYQCGNIVAALVVFEGGYEGVAELNEHRDMRHGADALAGHGRHAATGRLCERLQVAQCPCLVRVLRRWRRTDDATRSWHVSECHNRNSHLLATGQCQCALHLVTARRTGRYQNDHIASWRRTAPLQHLRNTRRKHKIINRNEIEYSPLVFFLQIIFRFGLALPKYRMTHHTSPLVRCQ